MFGTKLLQSFVKLIFDVSVPIHYVLNHPIPRLICAPCTTWRKKNVGNNRRAVPGFVGVLQ